MKKTFEHILIIPTNRRIEDCFKSYLREARRMEKRLAPAKIIFCVLEDGNDDVSSANESFFNKTGELDVPTKYVSRSLREKFVKNICHIRPELERSFLGASINYGRVTNLSSLIGAYYCCKFMHRRDSDTLLYSENGEDLYPSDFEIPTLTDPGKNALVVGGNYFLNWNSDLYLFEQNEGLIREFFRLLDIPDFVHDILINKSIKGDLVPTRKNREIFLTDGPYPDMGNVSFSAIYKEVPVSPRDNAMGQDYFIIRCLMVLKKGVYLHNSNVVHCYEAARRSEDHLLDYYARLANTIDEITIYREFYKELAMRRDQGLFVSTQASLAGALKKLPMVRAEREERLTLYRNLISKTNWVRKEHLIKRIEAQTSEVLDEGERSIKDHLVLHSVWRELMKSAQASEALEVRT